MDYSGLHRTDEELKAFFEEALFVGEPGSEYGATDQFYRYSIAVPPSMLRKSMEVLRRAVEKAMF